MKPAVATGFTAGSGFGRRPKSEFELLAILRRKLLLVADDGAIFNDSVLLEEEAAAASCTELHLVEQLCVVVQTCQPTAPESFGTNFARSAKA